MKQTMRKHLQWPGTRISVCVCVVAIVLACFVFFAGCGGSTKAGNGGSSTGGVSEAELGVPIYPGAKKDNAPEDATVRRPWGSSPQAGGGRRFWNGGSSVPGPQSATSSGSFLGTTRPTMLWTPDSIDKVTTWYRQKLSGKTGFREITHPGAASAAEGATTAFSFTSGKATKRLMIRKSQQSKGGTIITISDIPEGAPQIPPVNQNQQ